MNNTVEQSDREVMFRLTVTTTRYPELPVTAETDYYGRFDAMTALLCAFNDVADDFDRGYLTAVCNYVYDDSFEYSASRDGVAVHARVARVHSDVR